MKFNRETTWGEVFEGWRDREANNPGWVECATKIKGWSDWESWRRFTASQIKAEDRKWQIFDFTDPLNEVPNMLIGPYGGWQSRVIKKNKTTFQELLGIREQYDFFNNHNGVLSILKGLPFPTEFIGFIRKDLDTIVCLEGHHRATALALAKMKGAQIDFTRTPITIALAELSQAEIGLLDEILKRGTSKNPESSCDGN